MFNEKQTKQCAAYVMERARFVIDSYGPRPPGSEAEKRAQELVKQELEACCDGEVRMEPFQVAQKAFFFMQSVAAIIVIIAVSMFRLHPLAALGVDAIALAVLYFQLYRYKLLLDPFFPKKTSHNVYGAMKPRGEVKRRVILNGHPDAAYEWRFNYLAPRQFPIFVLASLLGMFGIILLHLIGLGVVLFVQGEWMIKLFRGLEFLQLFFLPGAALGLFFNNLKVVAPGANDNLTGTFLSTGILRTMKDAGIELEHTEVAVAITGSEEAGLRGAKVFAREHRNDFRDVPTIVIVIDTMRDIEHFTVYNKDLNGTVEHDAAVCKLLQDSGRACGLNLPLGTVFLGSSDGAAFTQEGFRVGMLGAMDPHPADYYHTRRDTADIMDKNCIAKTAAVVGEAIRRVDTGEWQI